MPLDASAPRGAEDPFISTIESEDDGYLRVYPSDNTLPNLRAGLPLGFGIQCPPMSALTGRHPAGSPLWVH